MQRTDTAQQPAQRLPGSTLLLRFWIWLQIRYHIAIVADDLRYLRQLESGGVLDGLSIRAFRSQIAIREARVIALEADLRALRQELAHG